MSAFLVVDIAVHDPDVYEEYKARVPPLIARHGGDYAARGGVVEVMEGDWQPNRMVLVRFPDLDAARAFMNDPDYEPVKSIRQRSASSRVILVEGLD